MNIQVEGKKIVLGITGSIACYKAVDLCSKLVQAGAIVNVILSDSASKFVSPITFQSIVNRPVITDLFDPDSTNTLNHIALAQEADLVVIAPATANTIAKLAAGLADDALTTTVLATQAPMIIAPAMDGHMYSNSLTQNNIKKLENTGIKIVGPSKGRLASGMVGIGRLVTTEELLGHISAKLAENGALANKQVIVTAGGTIEAIDPMRIITNRSSGKMGYALAEAARDLGANTILITSSIFLPDPPGIETQHVESAIQMKEAIISSSSNADILIMAAAVADYKPITPSEKKLKKNENEVLTLELTKTPDILSEINGPKIKVGFAAETEDLEANALKKMISKKADLFIANHISEGVGLDTNKVTIINSDGTIEKLPAMEKYKLAQHILSRVTGILNRQIRNT